MVDDLAGFEDKAGFFCDFLSVGIRGRDRVEVREWTADAGTGALACVLAADGPAGCQAGTRKYL